MVDDKAFGFCSNGCPMGCDCPEVDDPVCGFNAETFRTPCDAECAGEKLKCKGPCPCKTGYTNSNSLLVMTSLCHV